MEPSTSTLFHRVIRPRHPSPDGRHPLLVLLHGRGANEEDLAALADVLDGRFLAVAVRAPFAFVYGPGFTWYEFDAVGSPEPKMFRAGYERLIATLQEITATHPVDPSRVYLFGFSMGTVMSHAVALSRPDLVRGVVANSGYVPEQTSLAFRWDALKHLDIIITHGVMDEVIPVSMGRRARELYEASPANLDYREYPMGHQISQESLDDVAAWLTRSLGTAPARHA
jgi:phospholipase/carboxylesterase